MQQAEREKLVLNWRERWHPYVLQFLARQLPVQADAADLAQEVYLRLLRVDKLDLIRNPRTYLCRVAINIAHEWRLRSAKMPTTTEDEVSEDTFTAPDNLEAWLDRHQNRDVVRAALMALPLNQRTALVLHVTRDLTNPEIAVHMGVTRRQVKRYLAAAYERLRQDMIGAGVKRPPTDTAP